MTLVEEIYTVTRRFPSDERFGLTSQLRRAAVSIPSNIAEGQGRGSDGQFLPHLHLSYGSLREVETQVILAKRLEFLRDEEASALLDECGEVGRLLNGLMKSIAA